MSRAFNLYRLQQVDTQLDRLRARLVEIGGLLGEDAAVQTAREALTRAETDLNAAGSSLHSAERMTRDQRIKIEQTENTLYSGKVANPKELQDLQMELAAHKRYLDTLEERQLEAMLAVEEAESGLNAVSKTLEQAAADSIAGDAALTGEQSRIKSDVARLESERGVANNAVTAEDRELYHRLRIKRGGVAVASAVNRSCGACGTSLNAALYHAVRTSTQLMFCDTCGRVLYVG
ncbi:MAG TPA: C4-type zinc ribbon domain-containing protein [Anaerolineales bacterium]|nr:C4-type zinc ribbon domain-containing protein [Anaerolineales bacterium]